MSIRPLRLGGAALLVSGLLAWPGTGVLAAAPTSCSTPELAAIDGELLKARVAIAAGDEETLQASLTAARDALDEILSACWAGSPPEATAGPSAGPGEHASLTLGGRLVSYPADLAPVQTDLLRGVDREGHTAETVTLADSEASGELLDSPLETPVPEGFRAISLAIGDPQAVLVSTGGFELSETLDATPADALAELGTRIEAATRERDTRVTVTGSHPVGWPDGGEGAAIDVDFVTADGTLLAKGRFVVRPLAEGDWALGVAVAAEAGLPALSDELELALAALAAEAG